MQSNITTNNLFDFRNVQAGDVLTRISGFVYKKHHAIHKAVVVRVNANIIACKEAATDKVILFFQRSNGAALGLNPQAGFILNRNFERSQKFLERTDNGLAKWYTEAHGNSENTFALHFLQEAVSNLRDVTFVPMRG